MSSKPTGDENVDPKTEVIGDGAPAAAGQQTPDVNEWWQETGEQPTQVLGPQGADQPTQVLGSQAADQPTTVLGSQDAPHPTEVLPAAGTGPQHTETLDVSQAQAPQHTEAFSAGEAAAYAAGAQSVSDQGQPPVAPPPGTSVGGQGGSGGVPRKRRTGLIIGIVAALLVVGGLAGGEAYARNKVSNCIAAGFEKQMGSKIDVSFGAKPMLLTMFDGKVGKVTVDSDDTKFGPAQGMVVHATFNDIEIKDGGRQGGTIGSSSADVTWSNSGIVTTLGGLVSGATSDPNADTLNFAVLGGIAELQVKPKVVNGKVDVETMSASLLGFGLPTDLVDGIVDLLSESLQTYPMGMQPTSVEVTKDGLHVTLKGGRADLEAPTEGQQTEFTC